MVVHRPGGGGDRDPALERASVVVTDRHQPAQPHRQISRLSTRVRCFCSVGAPSPSMGGRRRPHDVRRHDVGCRWREHFVMVDAAYLAIRPSRRMSCRVCICCRATGAVVGWVTPAARTLWECGRSTAAVALRTATCGRLPRISCNQDIAADGFFSLGCSPTSTPAWNVRPVVLSPPFLGGRRGGTRALSEAEAAGVRATGSAASLIRCTCLGLRGHAFQSLLIYGRCAGRRCPPDNRAGIFVGGK